MNMLKSLVVALAFVLIGLMSTGCHKRHHNDNTAPTPNFLRPGGDVEINPTTGQAIEHTAHDTDD